VNPKYWKQCMCEKKPRFDPRFCSKEGGTCKQCVGYVVYGAFKYQGDGSTAGGSKTVRKGCYADGGSGDDGKKDGNKRAIPEMVSSGKGCGADGIAACEQAAIAKGYNTFGI
jgi:hypothetical protein